MKKYFFILLILVFFIVLSLSFKKQSILISDSSCLLLKSANYFNTDTGMIVQNTDIIVSHFEITSIAANLDQLGQQMNCTILNSRLYYLMPSLIDAHTHLLAFDKQKVSSWKEALQLSSEKNNHARLSIGFENARSMLLHGFTTVRDLGNSGYFLDYELKKLLDTGAQPELQLIYSGPGVAVAPSQIDLNRNSKEYLIVKSESDIDLIIESIKSHEASWLKLYADNSRGSTQLMPLDLMAYFIKKAHQNNISVAIHSEYNSSADISLQSEADSIEHLYQLPTSTSYKKPYVVITDIATKACQNLKTKGFGISNCEDQLADLNKRLLWLKNNNFQIVFGSDSVLDFTSLYENRGQAALASLLNWKKTILNNREILVAATAVSGKMLKQNIGQIKQGYKANLLILSENPLKNLETLATPVAILKDGKTVCGLNQQKCVND